MTLTTEEANTIVSLQTEISKIEQELKNIPAPQPALQATLEPDIQDIKNQIEAWRAANLGATRSEYIAAIQPLKDQLRTKIDENETIKAQNAQASQAASDEYKLLRQPLEDALASAKNALSDYTATVVVP